MYTQCFPALDRAYHITAVFLNNFELSLINFWGNSLYLWLKIRLRFTVHKFDEILTCRQQYLISQTSKFNQVLEKVIPTRSTYYPHSVRTLCMQYVLNAPFPHPHMQWHNSKLILYKALLLILFIFSVHLI